MTKKYRTLKLLAVCGEMYLTSGCSGVCRGITASRRDYVAEIRDRSAV